MIGQTISHYSILEKLGEGGMGVVYKAQDTKLDRFVALKFLPSHLAASEQDKSRFIQEAKSASALNHPNVCTIHDISEHDGPFSAGAPAGKQLFIVMEFVDGKSLKDKKEQLGQKQILEIGIQVAEGLAAAHEKGIVHRDIKPDNIMIRKDGIVQIMDFGLAKLYTSGNVSRLTKAGTTMGTMGYMSPEQVQGLDVDHRTDIFSLGVVLYELLAGESPFKGVHETAIMYEIVNVDPAPLSTIKQDIEMELDNIILECLEKEKDDRCQSAKELAKDLRKIKKSTGHTKSRAYTVNTKTYRDENRIRQERQGSSGSVVIEIFNQRFDLRKVFSSGLLPWGLASILFVLVLYFAYFSFPETPLPVTSVSSILPPHNVNISGNSPDLLRISHDGTTVVFSGRDTADGFKFKLWVRPLHSNTARIVPGCEDASYPFWSPDDKSVAFFSNGSLMRVNINSGYPVKICDARQGRGGAWNQGGKIVFAPDYIGGLFIVSASGGTPVEIVRTDSTNMEQSLRFPFFLPDGNHFLYTAEARFSGASSGDMIKVGSVDGSVEKDVLQESSNAQYADGYIFFVRQNNLMCQQFDTKLFAVSGDPQMIASEVRYNDGLILGAFSVSNRGSIFLQNQNVFNLKLALFDLTTKKIDYLIERNRFVRDARFSPDGKKCVFVSPDLDGKYSNIWTYDISRKNTTRITFQNKYDVAPIWSPDGKSLVYSSFYKGSYNLYMKNSDGAGRDSLIYFSEKAKYASHWSSDGKDILVNVVDPMLNVAEVLSLDKVNSIRTFMSSEFNAFGFRLSRDKKWILINSDESGNNQFYLRSYDGSEKKWQITTEGGFFIGWIKNDTEFIYGKNKKIYRIRIALSSNSVTNGSPEVFSDIPENVGIHDISPSGEQLLVTTAGGISVTRPYTYIQNWKGLLNEKYM